MKNLIMRLLARLTPHYSFPVLGHVEAFPNKLRSFLEADHYLRIPVVCTGQREYLLLTPHEYSNGRQRANRNPEDCPVNSGFVARYLWPVLRRSSYQRVNQRPMQSSD